MIFWRRWALNIAAIGPWRDQRLGITRKSEDVLINKAVLPHHPSPRRGGVELVAVLHKESLSRSSIHVCGQRFGHS